jgi:separase
LKITSNASSTAKAARHLEVLSQTVLSLCPSISASEDAQATNPKVCVSPPTAFRLQYLAFEARLIWWKLSGHQGDLEREILDPFGRCFGVFVRRAVLEPQEKYLTALTLFNNIVMRFENDGLPFSFDGAPTDASKLPLVNIYKALGFLAQEALLTEDAVRWTKETLGLLYGTSASDARRCSCLTRLATLMLRKAGSGPLSREDFEILANSLEGLTGSLRGDSGELDELLTDVSTLRRAAIGYLSRMKVESSDKELMEICKSLVFTCLHFFTRYLGNPPGTDSDAKSITRFGQRRKVVRKVALSTIDSVLSVLKTAVSADEICWDTMDATLQDCSVLGSRLDIPCGSDREEIGSTFVKISNIYWAYYLKKRKPSTDFFEAQLLRCLRRSVEAIRHRSQAEKEAGLLAVKLERLGGIYQSQGRWEEAKDSLVDSIQVHIGNGTLKAAAGEAAKRPFSSVWNGEDDIGALGRVLVALVKIWFRGQGPLCAGPPFDDLVLPAEERAALLEWQLVATARMLDTNDVTHFCSAVRAISDALVGIYGSDFPIRRARLSVLLLCLAVNHPGLLASDFVDFLAGEAASTTFDLASGNDTALTRYQHHLKASISVCLSFRNEDLDADKLKSAISAWLGLTDSCNSWSAITEVIDSPDIFLSQLQATIDFFDMKGFGPYRIPALRLLVRVRELQEPVDSEALTKALSALGLQYLRLGYSGKAGLSLAKAQGYMEKVGGSSQAKLQWHLAYAEYLVELGNVDKWYISSALCLLLVLTCIAASTLVSQHLLQSMIQIF